MAGWYNFLDTKLNNFPTDYKYWKFGPSYVPMFLLLQYLLQPKMNQEWGICCMRKVCHAASHCQYCIRFDPQRFSPSSEDFSLHSSSPLLLPRVQFTVCTRWRVTEETIYLGRSVGRTARGSEARVVFVVVDSSDPQYSAPTSGSEQVFFFGTIGTNQNLCT